MLSHVLLAFLVSIPVSYANEETPCCYPTQMSGETLFRGTELNRFYIDYDRQVVVEDWQGKFRTRFFVYDLQAMKRYRLKDDGTCSVTALTSLGNFAQCVPQDAYTEAGQGGQLTYTYQLQDIEVVKTVSSVHDNTCLPLTIAKTKVIGKEAKRVVLTYRAEATVSDDSIFEMDLSHCL